MYSGEARVDTGKTLFAQLMEFLPWDMFRRIIARYGGDPGFGRWPALNNTAS
jgi:hypothetical protein